MPHRQIPSEDELYVLLTKLADTPRTWHKIQPKKQKSASYCYAVERRLEQMSVPYQDIIVQVEKQPTGRFWDVLVMVVKTDSNTQNTLPANVYRDNLILRIDEYEAHVHKAVAHIIRGKSDGKDRQRIVAAHNEVMRALQGFESHVS